MRMVVATFNGGHCDNIQECGVMDLFVWINKSDHLYERLRRLFVAASVWSAFENYPHNYSDPKLRHCPMVIYDPLSDDCLFMIKQDNNGTVYFVGQDQLPEWLYRYLDYIIVMDEFYNFIEITSLDDYKNTWRMGSTTKPTTAISTKS